MFDFIEGIRLAYVVSGFAVGFLVGMTGVGGGSLMTPMLILFFGISPERAVATDLIYASITKTGGSFIHGLNKTIDWRIVFRLAAGSIPGTILMMTTLYVLQVDSHRINSLLTFVLAIALLLTALALVFRRWLTQTYTRRVGTLDDKVTRKATIITGFVLGALVSLSSVGAGALGVTALILLYPKIPIVRIAGSDIAHAVPLTLLAGLGHSLILGPIDVSLLTSLLIGSLPGIMLSSFIAPKIPDVVLRSILAVTLFAVAVRLLA
ncbi:MAG TPA: sulfite exporter TauE/SafE family protein [Rhizomicrobium sp.]|nr:sulfite exporter TauE/SafE family protein [Rhizomicrobium sp.]